MQIKTLVIPPLLPGEGCNASSTKWSRGAEACNAIESRPGDRQSPEITHQSQELEERPVFLGGRLSVAGSRSAATTPPPLERADGSIPLLVCAGRRPRAPQVTQVETFVPSLKGRKTQTLTNFKFSQVQSTKQRGHLAAVPMGLDRAKREGRAKALISEGFYNPTLMLPVWRCHVLVPPPFNNSVIFEQNVVRPWIQGVRRLGQWQRSVWRRQAYWGIWGPMVQSSLPSKCPSGVYQPKRREHRTSRDEVLRAMFRVMAQRTHTSVSGEDTAPIFRVDIYAPPKRS